jgi:hypothetical protein
MTREQLLTYVAAILTTALETEPSPFPESMAYLALGSDMAAWETVRRVLVGGQLVTINGHAIALTAKGRTVAQDCNAVLGRQVV